VDPEALAHVPALVLVLASARHVLVALEHQVEQLRRQAKLLALRVLRDRRAAVAVSNIQRPKKAR
jgi:hypothetical protein